MILMVLCQGNQSATNFLCKKVEEQYFWIKFCVAHGFTTFIYFSLI